MPTAAEADPEAVRRLMRLGLTVREATAFLYIFTTAMECGYQPSLRDLMAQMGATSPNSAAMVVSGLERAGFVKRGASESRALRLLLTPQGTPFRGFVLPEEPTP